MKSAISNRTLLWITLPVLSLVVIALALLQYHWSALVSAASISQMRSSLHITLLSFRQDFNRELVAACLEARAAADDSAQGSSANQDQQADDARKAAPRSALIAHIYLWQMSREDQLFSLNTANQLEAVSWPPGFDRLRDRLRVIAQMHGAAGQGALRHHLHRAETGRKHRPGHAPFWFPLWWVDESAAVAASLLHFPGMPDKDDGDSATTWILVQLDRNALEKQIFPELTQKYFSGGAGYRVAVRQSSGEKTDLLYSSSTGFGAGKTPVDAALNLFLFGPSMRRGPEMPGPGPSTSSPDAERRGHRQRWRGSLPPAEPGGPNAGGANSSASNARGPNGNGGANAGANVSANERQVRLEPLYSSGEGWEIVVQHPSGSLEEAVNGLRWRNLSVSFGVLVVLAITMALVVINSQRARRLAMLQMDFVAGVSHELRTPLAVISSAAENIAHGIVTDKDQVVRYGASILKQSRQLSQLVEQVLVFAATRQETPKNIHLRPLDVAEVMDAALENTADIINGSAITVERQIQPGLPAVAADFGALSQCLQNLITNAVKYGGERRWMGIRASAVMENGVPREVAVTIEDHGIGIDSSEIGQIFDPFYRSPAVSGSTIHGTGLGLPLARRLIEAMRGRIAVKSELGKGTAFTIYLPAADASPLSATAEPSTATS
ncbi:MAG TPA: HAMP domain-containing sensor histidine kinase [Candidatus Angelobacter sp.]|nr:HAMP domain-containing sensor histidine kinase [Candidatus Angelobacter sp.]